MSDIPRHMATRCKSCLYFDRHDNEEYFDGLCRRRSPTVVLNRYHDPADRNDDSQPYVTWFPRVISTEDWCGDYEEPHYE